MSDFTMSENLKSFGLKQLLHYLDRDPDENVPKILDWVERFDKKGVISDQLAAVRPALTLSLIHI